MIQSDNPMSRGQYIGNEVPIRYRQFYDCESQNPIPKIAKRMLVEIKSMDVVLEILHHPKGSEAVFADDRAQLVVANGVLLVVGIV